MKQLDAIINRARTVAIHGDTDAAALANSILSLLAEDAPCGWEAPNVGTLDGEPRVRIPNSWPGLVTPDDARALARMLMRAADSADGGVK